MAAPVDPRRARSRRKLLDAAVELLLSGGTAAVTVEAVTNRSGVARTTLYRNFSSSQALIAGAFGELLPRAAAAEGGGPRERMLDLMLRQYDLVLAAPMQDALMAWLVMGTTTEAAGAESPDADELGELRRTVLERYLEPTAAILEDAVAAGMLKASERHAAIARLYGPPVLARLIGLPQLSRSDLEQVVNDVLGAED